MSPKRQRNFRLSELSLLQLQELARSYHTTMTNALELIIAKESGRIEALRERDLPNDPAPGLDEIILVYDLWEQYIDPDHATSQEEFERMSVDERWMVAREILGLRKV